MPPCRTTIFLFPGSLRALCMALLWAVASVAPPALADSPLRDHPSPYLALHADDPVQWREWNEETLQLARDTDRPLFLSIGYFACHWCHVMQRESFQNQEIAARLNQRFIPVKIDRELESALDAQLIEFAEATLGYAGWPLNVVVIPDGYPFFAVIYMPPEQFQQVLDRVDDLWNDRREWARDLARRVAEVNLPPAGDSLDLPAIRQLQTTFLEQAQALHDDFEGGFGSQNKFPQAPALIHLLELARSEQFDAAAPILQLTLDTMAAGGLYDHLGGGFFRYVVDPGWVTPHFEKMLYDNAQLARVYLRADRVFPGQGHGAVARATLDFMGREMATDGGALIASFSALDGNDEEGGYYLFRDAELEAALDPDELRALRIACDVSGVPQLAAGHHLRCSLPLQQVAASLDLTQAATAEILESARRKLQTLRQTRVLPADTKQLAGWNGLALSAFSEAAGVWPDAGYGDTASAIRDAIVERLWDGDSLVRARSGSTALGSASIEDYAYVAGGLWDFATLTDSDEDRELARRMVIAGFRAFRDGNGWRLEKNSLLAATRPRELITDSPMASPAAVLAGLAIAMARHFCDEAMWQLAYTALNRGHATLFENTFFHATHIHGLNQLADTAAGETLSPQACDGA